ncbi:cytochrome oxidase small assembly protein [Paraburkholderia sp. DHOC27]|nr:cytochrome oxidase small assembly protein [Paraburkholderia sp. DHOC27]
MAPNSPKQCTPEQIRAGNLRLGLVLLVIAAAFFVGIFVKQSFFS